MDEFGSVLSQLVKSRQQVDTLEKEVEARSRENLLLRQQLQELTRLFWRIDSLGAQRLELGGAKHCIEVFSEDSDGEPGWGGGRVQAAGVG